MAIYVAALLSQALILTSRIGHDVKTGSRISQTAMQLERKPGEGDPFSPLCPRPDEFGNAPDAAKRTDVGFDRWHSDSGYIEEDSEPWHATSKASPGYVDLEAVASKVYSQALPFIAAEDALAVALSKVASVDDINKAVAACLAAGGRKGCPAILDAQKIIKAAEKDGEVKPAKAPKNPAQAAGWDSMSRGVAKVHDNSV